MTIPTVLSKPSGALYIPITLPNQHGSLWNLKLELLGSCLVDSTHPGHPLWSISPSGALWSPSRALYILISLLNQLGSLWNLNLNLMGSQLVDPTYHDHPHCSISALWIPLEPSGDPRPNLILIFQSGAKFLPHQPFCAFQLHEGFIANWGNSAKSIVNHDEGEREYW